MKKLKRFLPKTKRAGIITLAVASGLIVGGIGVTRSEAAMDWLGLEQKLQHIDERNDNQDDRIGNTEKDVEKLQEDTNTEPAIEKTVVREVVTENNTVTNTPGPESTPEPILVTSYKVIPISEKSAECRYSYSDGTTKTFTWKSAYFNSSGAEVTKVNGKCDQSVVGSVKQP